MTPKQLDINALGDVRAYFNALGVVLENMLPIRHMVMDFSRYKFIWISKGKPMRSGKDTPRGYPL
jgi:hypothetical protein